MVKSLYIAIVGLVLILSACTKNNAIIERRVELNPFEEVELRSSFDVELVEDTVFYVELLGHEKTVKQVELKIESGVLLIDNLLKNKFAKPKTKQVTLIIHGALLKKVVANETCFVRTRNAIQSPEFGIVMKSKGNFAELELQTEVFYFWNNYPCGGKMTLRGSTNQLKLWNTAIFSVDAKALQSKYCIVDNSSKGKCEVRVSEAIEYKIRGEGNVEVYGAPSIVVEKEKSGNGSFVLY